MTVEPRFALVLIAVFGVASGCDPAPPPQRVQIPIAEMAYRAPSVTVKVGDVVVFVNRDLVPHNAVEADGGFETAIMHGGDSAEVVLTTPGTFEYTCAFHPGMAGAITVSR